MHRSSRWTRETRQEWNVGTNDLFPVGSVIGASTEEVYKVFPTYDVEGAVTLSIDGREGMAEKLKGENALREMKRKLKDLVAAVTGGTGAQKNGSVENISWYNIGVMKRVVRWYILRCVFKSESAIERVWWDGV